MAKFGGFGGGMPNMQNLMKQAQKMQAEMLEKQAEVNTKDFESSVGGGAVKVKCSGDKVIKEIKIKEDVVDKEDIEMLEDLIKTAVNEAMAKADNAMQSSMGSFNIPGLM